MPNLRQLVIAAEDPARLAAFYSDVFELEKIDDADGAVFLSDGTFNLAIAAEPDGQKQGIRMLCFDTTRWSPCAKDWRP
jgi:predicted enzyme related to lactoylglutathione lyase